jgi:hypothetical protein
MVYSFATESGFFAQKTVEFSQGESRWDEEGVTDVLYCTRLFSTDRNLGPGGYPSLLEQTG